MKMSGGPASVNIKIILLIIAVLIAGGTLFYTQNLVGKLQNKERQMVELYAKVIEHIANSSSTETDITFLFDNFIKPIDFPMILTDADDKVDLSTKSNVRNIRNINYDTSLSDKDLETFFENKIKEI